MMVVVAQLDPDRAEFSLESEEARVFPVACNVILGLRSGMHGPPLSDGQIRERHESEIKRSLAYMERTYPGSEARNETRAVAWRRAVERAMASPDACPFRVADAQAESVRPVLAMFVRMTARRMSRMDSRSSMVAYFEEALDAFFAADRPRLGPVGDRAMRAACMRVLREEAAAL